MAAVALPVWLDPNATFHGNVGLLLLMTMGLIAGGGMLGFSMQLDRARFLEESRDWWVKHRLREDRADREIIKRYEDAKLKAPDSLLKG